MVCLGNFITMDEYLRRINHVVGYIRENLDQELSTTTLAEISCFSRFHFQRIFKSVTGQTVGQYVKSVRLERATQLLAETPTKPISEISSLCGFTNTSTFSRAFKEEFQMTANEWRREYADQNDHIQNQMEQTYSSGQMPSLEENDIKINAEVMVLDELIVAYLHNSHVHVHDSATYEKMFEKLFAWAISRGMFDFGTTKTLTVYRQKEGSRETGFFDTELCVSIPSVVQPEGDIKIRNLTGGNYLVIHMEKTVEENIRTWQYVFDHWFPASSYVRREGDFYIRHFNHPKNHPENIHMVDVCIPIE